MKLITINLFYCLFLVLFYQTAYAQCTPAADDQCIDAFPLCYLNFLNGYSCSNVTYSNTANCIFECDPLSKIENAGWWSFVSHGGKTKITFTFANCLKKKGIQAALFEDCLCAKSVACESSCSTGGGINSFQLEADLQACRTYFLVVDGCEADICDFTINVQEPPYDPRGQIGKINNVEGRVLYLVPGLCEKEFFVDIYDTLCNSKCIWTMDGIDLPETSNKIKIDMPYEGDFVLCVQYQSFNPKFDALCTAHGPVCLTLKLRKINPLDLGPDWIKKDSIGHYKIPKQADNIKYKWQVSGGTILTPNFEDSNYIDIKWLSGVDFGKVYLRLVSACDSTDLVCLPVKLNVPLNSIQISQADISIIPNPNAGKFKIINTSDLGIDDIQIIDVFGNNINYFISSVDEFTLTQNLKGIYFVKLQTKNFTKLIKILSIL